MTKTFLIDGPANLAGRTFFAQLDEGWKSNTDFLTFQAFASNGHHSMVPHSEMPSEWAVLVSVSFDGDTVVVRRPQSGWEPRPTERGVAKFISKEWLEAYTE